MMSRESRRRAPGFVVGGQGRPWEWPVGAAGMDEENANAFLTFLQVEKGASNNTIAAYRNDIFQFVAFCTSRARQGGAAGSILRRKTWRQVDKALILGFLADLQSKGYSQATVARKIAAVKSFF